MTPELTLSHSYVILAKLFILNLKKKLHSASGTYSPRGETVYVYIYICMCVCICMCTCMCETDSMRNAGGPVNKPVELFRNNTSNKHPSINNRNRINRLFSFFTYHRLPVSLLLGGKKKRVGGRGGGVLPRKFAHVLCCPIRISALFDLSRVRIFVFFFHRQSDEHWNGFKGDDGETSERRGGAHMGFTERTDTILNRTELFCLFLVEIVHLLRLEHLC